MNSSHINKYPNSVYVERLQHVKRVMRGLSKRQLVNNFDMRVYAVETEAGIIASVSGYCGLDSWFQDRGFITTVGAGISIWTLGGISIFEENSFGTEQPFHRLNYPNPNRVTLDDIIAALDNAIASFLSVRTMS